MDIMEQHL
jgi:hypothetical protein